VSTHEIAITGITAEGRSFAKRGDSGGCVFVRNKEGTEYQAAGMLIGKSLSNEFVLVTPFDMILASARE